MLSECSNSLNAWKKNMYLTLFRKALKSGGRVFFTDILQEEGLKTKSNLASEYGENNVEFSVQVSSELSASSSCPKARVQ